LLAGPFGDGAGSSADEALYSATALGALLDRGIAHLLPLLKMAGAFFAEILIRWHRSLSWIVSILTD
jgi:hypothetical protein